jgi:hypothetical protein
MIIKRKFAERPNRQKYLNYKGVLGEVVGIRSRADCGHIQYEMKCAECGEIHLRDSKHLKQGIRSQECKEYHPPNYTGLEKRDGIIRNQYGITLAQYNTMLEAQNYKCAICGNEDEVEGRRLAIDHCHTSGKVRGLLCGKCNRGLGLFYDNTINLAKAIEYLTKD